MDFQHFPLLCLSLVHFCVSRMLLCFLPCHGLVLQGSGALARGGDLRDAPEPPPDSSISCLTDEM